MKKYLMSFTIVMLSAMSSVWSQQLTVLIDSPNELVTMFINRCAEKENYMELCSAQIDTEQLQNTIQIYNNYAGNPMFTTSTRPQEIYKKIKGENSLLPENHRIYIVDKVDRTNQRRPTSKGFYIVVSYDTLNETWLVAEFGVGN